MTRWSADRERRAVVAHVARCRFCRALLAYSRTRRDRELLAAAEALAADHALADAEHEAFARSAAKPAAAQQSRSSSMRMAVPGGDDAA